jgi:lipoprotein-anchoring transpeptidase ErfK/SrfK
MRARNRLVGSVAGFLFFVLVAASAQIAADAAKAAPTAADSPAKTSPVIEVKVPAPDDSATPAFYPVTSWLEAQIALAREGISSGSIDGVGGAQSGAALRAYQEREGIPITGVLDDDVKAHLVLMTPALTKVILSREDVARLQPLGKTWLEKSNQTALEYETALELIAERTHASPALIRRLNPAVDWTQPAAGTILTVPEVDRTAAMSKAAILHISLSDHVLEARDDAGRLIVHFPVSIARMAEKRPEGELHVTVVIPDPNYTFDPAVFPESEEGRQLGRKLVVPPGPNNPVGVAWIGLDRPGYGIHGTPLPELVGRTESHGCFRLANWDALTLLDLAWVGLPVIVDP